MCCYVNKIIGICIYDILVLGKELILKLQGHYFVKFVLVVINFSKFNNYVSNKEHPI